MTRRTLSLLIIMLVAQLSLYAVPFSAGMSFKQYSLAQGLSQSTVFDIVQDELGSLWIATDDGLNQFDGQDFTIYRHSRGDASTTLSNFTRALFIDKKGDLWIGSESGLSRYNRRLQIFTNYPTVLGEIGKVLTIYDIIEFNKGLLLATEQGLCYFNVDTGYQMLSFQGSRVMTLRNFMHYILVGSDQGLYCYYPQTDTYELLHESFRGVSILALEPHRKEPNKIWIGTDGNGLFCYDVSQKESAVYLYDDADDTTLSSNFVRSLCYDSSGTLWVGTFVGLNLSKIEGKFERHYYDQGEYDEISQNSVRAIFQDRQGGMWCGTYFGGLNYHHPMRNRFQHICHSAQRNSVNDNVIGAMLCDEKTNVWIGTNDNGLNFYDRTNDLFTSYSHKSSDKYSIPSNNVKALLFSKVNQGVLVGTHGGGLSLFSPQSGKFRRLNIPDENVYSLLYNSDGNLWVGTLGGLYIYNEERDEIVESGWLSVLLRGYQIHSLLLDSQGHIWVGTDKGIYRNDGVGYDFVEIDDSKERHHKAHCFAEDDNGNIWVGTREGLFYYDYTTHQLVEMQKEYGLPQLVVYGILQDSFSQLWVSSNNGLVCYNKVTNKWRIYTAEDGLQSNQFNKYAYCVDKRGRMYFGGINGISAFTPEQLKDNPFAPQPIIHKLMWMNSLVRPGDDTEILDEAIEFAKKIKMPVSQSAFTVEITVPNYLASGKNRYAYKLEGAADDWIYTDDSHLIFSYLPSGKYTLFVRAANNDGKWSDGAATLEIEVLPQWWRTGWAIFLFFVISMVVMVLCINIYTSRKLMERKLELEREEKEKDHERNQAKIRFFINLAHEFRTPLTLIMSPLQEVISQGVHNRWMHSQLDYMMRNCKRLLSLIDQTLDYRRSELGVLGLHVSKQPLNLFIKEVFELFAKEAEMRGINYNLIGVPDEDITLLYDANYLDRILTNLISNAFKYSSKGDSIELVVVVREKMLQLEVHDTGCGISPENIERVFDRFYQVEENTKGTGIGLSFVQSLVNNYKGRISVTSRLGEGSVFKVLVSTCLEEFEPSEIATDNKQYKDIIERMRNSAPVSDKSVVAPAEGDEEFTKQADGETKRIMLVEDDEEVRSYLLQAFSQAYDVEAYENGLLAWQRLQEQSNFDLILSDVMMPEMDGTTLCKKIKQNIQFCHIPIILLTAKSDLEDQLNAFSIGADDYIAKPFALSLVRSKIHNLFKSHQRILQRNASQVQEGNVAELVSNPLDEEFLKKAMTIIEENMDNPDFSTDDFSKAMFMSRSNLYLKLKALTGESAVEFIRRIRFSYACKLLKEGKYNVSEVSTMIGFSPSYFATSFKKYMGCLPSEYIKKS